MMTKLLDVMTLGVMTLDDAGVMTLDDDKAIG